MEEIKNMTIEELGRDLFAIYHGTHIKLVLGGDVSEDNIVFQNTLDELLTRMQSPIVQAMKLSDKFVLIKTNGESVFLRFNKTINMFEVVYLKGNGVTSKIDRFDSESEAIAALLEDGK